MKLHLSTQVNRLNPNYGISVSPDRTEIHIYSSRHNSINIHCPLGMVAYNISATPVTEPSDVEWEDTDGLVDLKTDGNKLSLYYLRVGSLVGPFFTCHVRTGTEVDITDESGCHTHKLTF